LSNIDNCFEQDLLRRVEPSTIKSAQSLSQAREWLSEAKKNLGSGAHRSALASIYLAIFHSARAVLFRDGIREKSHYCVGVYLEKYVKEGLLEEEWPMLFDRMRSVRHADQYSFQTCPTREEIESGIALAESFIKRMEHLLESR
jgi:uncharacterized protein (UPF0332 family)